MRSISISYPDNMLSALSISPEAFEVEARLALAVKMYELGRLTSGQAAILAGVSRVAFLLDCPRYGAASVAWDEAEIEKEFPEAPL